MKEDVRGLGKRIADRRREIQLTQEQLAERAKANVKTIQGVEQGRTAPELRTMLRIAKALETTLDRLAPPPGRTNPDRSVEAATEAILADLRKLPPALVEHLASIVRALAKGTRAAR